MNEIKRSELSKGQTVIISSSNVTYGVAHTLGKIKRILTRKEQHQYGIKVELECGAQGRVYTTNAKALASFRKYNMPAPAAAPTTATGNKIKRTDLVIGSIVIIKTSSHTRTVTGRWVARAQMNVQGKVKSILTNTMMHPFGIMVELENPSATGRVQEVISNPEVLREVPAKPDKVAMLEDINAAYQVRVNELTTLVKQTNAALAERCDELTTALKTISELKTEIKTGKNSYAALVESTKIMHKSHVKENAAYQVRVNGLNDELLKAKLENGRLTVELDVSEGFNNFLNYHSSDSFDKRVKG
jgi:uncharacterized repeat protein (TIGR03833 family)